MANTKHTTFRLDEGTKAKLEMISKVQPNSMTEIIKELIQDKYSEMQMQFINTSDVYGDMYPVTIDDYLELNPEGDFTQDDKYIYEDTDGDIEVIAARMVFLEWK